MDSFPEREGYYRLRDGLSYTAHLITVFQTEVKG